MNNSEDKDHVHYALFKPWGYLSQFIYNGKRKNKKKLLGELYDFVPGTMAIGRLDKDSEGLLLLTTDGKESFRILSQKFEKEYYVQVDGIITEEAVKQLKRGLEIGIQGKKYTTKPCKAHKMSQPDLPERARKIRDERHGPTSWVSITLREGKFRQVRKMTAAVGYPTLRLVRYRIGEHTIEGLNPGNVLPINHL
ncbi:MAG: pseudouridine synthase [Crocinitomicaceae bacterium]